MRYWLHRVQNHCNGLDTLFKHNRLTIGFSACAKDDEFSTNTSRMLRDEAYRNGEYGKDFDQAYKRIYKGDILRLRFSLWYFVHDMKADDIVVVPCSNGFNICKLKGCPIRSDCYKNDIDIGWKWDVDILAKQCSPRDSYAPANLLRSMKCRQTTICLDAIAGDVNAALTRFENNEPYHFASDLAKKCHDILDSFGRDEQFEQLVKNYFSRLGGQAEVLPKNDSSKKCGDCDVLSIFPALKLSIQVQCKKHWGTTNEWAVRQIVDYERENTASESEGWSCVKWVVSFADDFSEEAKELAKKEDVILISGKEFCKMLVMAGVCD